MVAIPASIQNVVIAGGGIIGTSTAYYLAHNYNIAVTIIDPVGIAKCASGKAGGFLAKEWRDNTPLEQLQRLGFQLHQDLANDLKNTKDDFKESIIDYRRLTCSAVSIDESTITIQKPRSKKLIDVEWVDHDTVIDSVIMGDEESIAQVHPRKLCEALWQSTKNKVNSKFIQGRIVKAVLYENDKDIKGTSNKYSMQSVVLEDGQIIPADTLVIACGPWTYEANEWFAEYNRNDDDDDDDEDSTWIPDITGVKCHSILVKSPKVLSQAVFFESDGSLGEGDLEVYPRPDGDCYVNGFPDDENFVAERPGQESLDPEALELLKKAMAQTASKELFSGQATTIPHTQQVCYWPETPDGLPFMGPLPGISGAYVAAGHSVWGILQGPATGQATAELIVEGKAKCLDLSNFKIDRM